ncbi:hypothetical protein M23134_04148 [Microscilla marina ATCC 23134]|uniref:Uncharacterized protein n=1 Tax=Microscilla marina ATCC 23134 TaxID=313606 RepID=A1ZE07_MICM2|nr:hypothetical protein M23134_04148 [Microscilla marina ATCC 23134]
MMKVVVLSEEVISKSTKIIAFIFVGFTSYFDSLFNNQHIVSFV